MFFTRRNRTASAGSAAQQCKYVKTIRGHKSETLRLNMVLLTVTVRPDAVRSKPSKPPYPLECAVSSSTRLNKIFILFNLVYTYVLSRQLPLGIVSAFSGAVKVIKSSTTCFHYTFFLYSYIAVKSKGRLTPSFALAHFFFRGFGSGVAASASCSTCSDSSRFSTSSM